MTSGRTGHWIKMRRSLAPFSGSESSIHTRSWADFITTTSGFRFSVHRSRGQVAARFANMPPCLIGMEACVGAHHLLDGCSLFHGGLYGEAQTAGLDEERHCRA